MPLQSTCERCGITYTHSYTYRVSRFCSRRCSTIATARTRPLEERFWQFVVKGDGCWEWSGTRNARGYGKIGRWHAGMDYAHRVSYELHVGAIPEGLHVLHHCDNPPCVRPDHLSVGTRRDNMQDAVAKGRVQHGERHYLFKMSNARIQEMSRRYRQGGVKLCDLATEFGISPSYASQLVGGKRRPQASTPPLPSR
jgi:hypothetical protein